MATYTTQYMIRVTHVNGLTEVLYASGTIDAADPDDSAQDAAQRAVSAKHPTAQVELARDQRGKLVTRKRSSNDFFRQ